MGGLEDHSAVTILYCPICRLVRAAGRARTGVHFVLAVPHNLTALDVGETLPVSYPATMADSTVVASPDALLAYLGRYIP